MYLDRIMGAGGASKGGTGMFERLTDRARRVMDLAHEEARLLNPSWAKLVSHINKLLRQMPPRWRVEGAR